MEKVVTGSRTKEPAYYLDLRPGSRIGDMACYYVLLHQWRLQDNDTKFYVLYNHGSWRSKYGKLMDLSWIFGSVVDEIWTDAKGENIPDPPNSQRVPNSIIMPHHWVSWAKLANNLNGLKPPLRMDEERLAKADEWLDSLNVPRPFATVQPLFDAGYHHYRNGTPVWWRTVIKRAAEKVPLVVLTGSELTQQLGDVRPATLMHNNEPMDTMAVMARSSLHLGAETGFTLWASVFGVPLLAAYRFWRQSKDGDRNIADFRPLPFSSWVLPVGLGGSVDDVAKQITSRFST